MMHWDWAANQEAGLDLHKLTWGSNRRANWICHKCPKGHPHRWTAVVFSICTFETSCPCCQGKEPCICNSLQSLSPDIAVEWDYSRNIGTPDDYSAQSSKKVWWHSSMRGSFEAIIQDRTHYKKVCSSMLHSPQQPCSSCSACVSPCDFTDVGHHGSLRGANKFCRPARANKHPPLQQCCLVWS